MLSLSDPITSSVDFNTLFDLMVVDGIDLLDLLFVSDILFVLYCTWQFFFVQILFSSSTSI